ncbi:hypothetical protein ACWEKM_11165 [Streptomyces sp. NPDC004752]
MRTPVRPYGRDPEQLGRAQQRRLGPGGRARARTGVAAVQLTLGFPHHASPLIDGPCQYGPGGRAELIAVRPGASPGLSG